MPMSPMPPAVQTWIEEVSGGSGPERKRIKIKVPIYGDISLSQEETDALKLPPNFKLFPKDGKREVQIQAEACRTKSRWDRRRRVMEKGKELAESLEPVSMEEVVEEEEYREVFNPVAKVCNFTKMLPTQVKNNPRVMIPGPRPPVEEVEIFVRTNQAMQ